MKPEKSEFRLGHELLHNKDGAFDILTLEPVSLGHGSGEAEEAFSFTFISDLTRESK